MISFSYWRNSWCLYITIYCVFIFHSLSIMFESSHIPLIYTCVPIFLERLITVNCIYNNIYLNILLIDSKWQHSAICLNYSCTIPKIEILEYCNGYIVLFWKVLRELFSWKTVQELFVMHRTSPYADTCIAKRRIRMSGIILSLSVLSWQIYYEVTNTVC